MCTHSQGNPKLLQVDKHQASHPSVKLAKHALD